MARPLSALVREALREDVGSGDITSAATVSGSARGFFLAKQDLVVCGLDVAREVFRQIGAKFSPLTRDGQGVKRGAHLARVSGPARAVLSGERVALNFMQRLSGVATLTRRFVELAKPAKILDTRKTTPGLRALEKYAVRCGGGMNHRMGLYDAVLIKDNHIAAVGDEERLHEIVSELAGKRDPKYTLITGWVHEGRGHEERLILFDPKAGDQPKMRRIQVGPPNSIEEWLEAYPRFKRKFKSGLGPIEIEAASLEQAKLFATWPVDIIMLDNFTAAGLKRAVREVRAINPKIILEASGGVNLKTVRAIGRTGVDWISVGAITHSAPAADISLEL